MTDLTDRQRAVLRFGAVRRFPDERALSAAVQLELKVPLRVYKSELTRALSHPEGFQFVHEVIGEEFDGRAMPQDLLDVLLFEARWRPDGGRKDDAIKHRFGFSRATYRARLEEALKHESAARIAPAVVRMNSVGRTGSSVS